MEKIKVEKTFEIGHIKKYEINILAGGECTSFIPMSFIEENNSVRVIYNTQGFCKLSIENLNNPYKVLATLEKIAILIKNANNHLILYNRYCIEKNNIYTNESCSEFKLIFLPKKNPSEIEFSQVIINLLQQFLVDSIDSRGVDSIDSRGVDSIDSKSVDSIDSRSAEYINLIIEKCKKFNLSNHTIINYIGELKRECYLCGWS